MLHPTQGFRSRRYLCSVTEGDVTTAKVDTEYNIVLKSVSGLHGRQLLGNMVSGARTPNEAEMEHARGKRALRLSPNPVTLIDSRPSSAHLRPEEGVDSPSNIHPHISPVPLHRLLS